MDRFSVPPVVQLVQALYDYRGENNDELCIRKGDVITVTQTPEGGWFEGTLNGITGWFPSNYVELLSPSTQNLHEGSNHHSQQPSQPHLNQLQENPGYRKMVIKEIVESESSFIKELKSMDQRFLTLLHESQVLPAGETQTVREAISAIISSHSRFLIEIHSLESKHSGKSGRSLRIGGLFMQFAAEFKQVHTDYCAIHPKFVSIIGQHKEAVAQILKCSTDDSHVSANLSLSNNLSFAFRRLDKYPALLQELQRYTEESDPDRGDTQRAGHFYRDLVSHCLEVRRKKEMELEVMLGNLKNWPERSASIQSLGPILFMENVIVTYCPEGEVHLKDRYLVLLERDLLLLSISTEMTSFCFETRIPVKDMTLPRVPASEENCSLEILVTKSNAESGGTCASGKFVFLFSSPELLDCCITAMQKAKKKYDSLAERYSTLHPSCLRPKESESSSVSSSSWTEGNADAVPLLNPRKSTVHSLTCGYWSTHSLLPHPVLKLPDVDAALASRIQAKQNRPKPSDDMAILQVIETYCPPGSTFKKKAVLSPATGSGSDASDPHVQQLDLKLLTDEVRSLKREMKQMRVEMECLADALRREREERKKLESLVSSLSYRHMT